jgi:hypothetical protein
MSLLSHSRSPLLIASALTSLILLSPSTKSPPSPLPLPQSSSWSRGDFPGSNPGNRIAYGGTEERQSTCSWLHIIRFPKTPRNVGNDTDFNF